VMVCVALISESPWPELDRECDGYGQPDDGCGPVIWVVWTDEDTGDGMRTACTKHLCAWVESVAARLWTLPEPR
jgi:hypothetical protein